MPHNSIRSIVQSENSSLEVCRLLRTIDPRQMEPEVGMGRVFRQRSRRRVDVVGIYLLNRQPRMEPVTKIFMPGTSYFFFRGARIPRSRIASIIM